MQVYSFKFILSFLMATFLCISLSFAKTKEKPISEEVKALQTEMMVTATEERAIDQVKLLINKYKGTQLEPDLNLRLAELYVRRAKTQRFLNIHRSSEEIVNLVPDLVKKAEPKKQLQLAIGIYDRIESRWPSFNRMDEVLFNNGFANQQLSLNGKAEQKFTKLIRIYDNSPLIPEAHLSVGEMKFQDRKFTEALKHFNSIESYPDSRVYPYGLYKAAWTHYNLRDAGQGIKSLEAVIKYGRFVSDQGIDARLDLRKEALTDLALFYEDVYPAKDAFEYFEKQARELDVAPVVLKLSSLYMRHSRHSDNRLVLKEFIKKRPKSDYITKAYIELMESSENLKLQTEVVGLLADMSEVCEPTSAWSKAQLPIANVDTESPLFQATDDPKKNSTADLVCNHQFERTALSYANKWLKQWQKDNKRVDFADVTEKAFEIFFKKDPKTDEASRARFVYAELLFKRNKFREASYHYAVSADRVNDEKLRHDANYYALISLEKAVNDKWSEKDEAQFKILAAEYIKDSPTGQYLLEVQFKLGFIAYEKQRYAEAAPLFKDLGDKFPKTEKGLKSQDLYLDILNKQKSYRELKDYAGDLRTKTKSQARVQKLTKIYEESYFLLIQQLEEKKDYVTAINEYQTFARKNTNSKLAQEALWNAMQISFKMGDLMNGSNAAVEFASKYRGDQRATDALIKAAKTYESLGQLPLASNVLLDLAQAQPAEKYKYLELAANFLNLSGKSAQAKKLYTELFEKAPGDYSARALYELEYLAEESKNPGEQERLLKRMLAMNKEPYTSKAQIYFLEKEFEKGNYPEVFKKSLAILGTKDALANTKARARLIQARILADEYKKQSIKSRLDRINIVLQIKTEKLSKAQVAYQSAARYGDPRIGVVAQSELADLYSDYAKSMREMPVPTGIEESEFAIFRAEMTKLAIPMEEKAFETKQLAYQQARSIGLDGPLAKELEKEVGSFSNQKGQESLVNFDSPDMLLPYPNGVGS